VKTGHVVYADGTETTLEHAQAIQYGQGVVLVHYHTGDYMIIPLTSIKHVVVTEEEGAA
jgi:hypothetical protein